MIERREVWIPACPSEVWRLAAVVGPGSMGDISSIRVAPLDGSAELDVLAADVVDVNPRGEDAWDDLTQLRHLEPPNVLHAIQARYTHDQVFTYVGPILISLNPWTELPDVFSVEMQQSYVNSEERPAALPPHIFAVADRAYARMRRDGQPQSILVSGESGAGKTESSKLLLQHLTSVSGSDTRGGLEGKLLESNPLLEAFGNAQTLRNHNSSRFGKLMLIDFDSARGHVQGCTILTYLLEKSRVTFQDAGEHNYHAFYKVLHGARALESSGTVADLAIDPVDGWYPYVGRGAHVSPAVGSGDAALAGRPAANGTPAGELGGASGGASAGSRGGTGEESDDEGCCDPSGALELARLMADLGMAAAQICSALTVVAALLHLGAVQFGELPTAGGDPAAHVLPGSEGALEAAARLLCVDCSSLRAALCARTLVTADGHLTIANTAEQAKYARDAFAKALWGGLFNALVAAINVGLQAQGSPRTPRREAGARGGAAAAEDLLLPERRAGAAGGPDATTPRAEQRPPPYQQPQRQAAGSGAATAAGARARIGVLDIFGFEYFERNSFEQLCINYANEKLQRQFNAVVFEAEQACYAEEGLSWEHVPFMDNAGTLELLEARPHGVLCLLDEECVVPRGSDEAFALKLARAHASHPSFRAPALARAEGFVVCHFAADVRYSVCGFLDKNKDALPANLIALAGGSADDLVRSLGGEAGAPVELTQQQAAVGPSPGSGRRGLSKQPAARDTLATQFRAQLAELVDMCTRTHCHYVRCINPNSSKARGVLERARVQQQLQCSGVTDAVRVMRAAYSARLPFAAFVERFRALAASRARAAGLPEPATGRVPAASAQNVGERSLDELADAICAVLSQPLPFTTAQPAQPGDEAAQGDEGGRALPLMVEGGWLRGRTKIFLSSAQLQTLEHARASAQVRAAACLQAAARGYMARRSVARARSAALCIQRLVRGGAARRERRALQAMHAARRLTRAARRMLCRRRIRCMRLAAVHLQCKWRAKTARRLHTAVVALQCAYRATCARRALRALRIDARTVGKVRKEKEWAQAQLLAMRARYDEQGKANAKLNQERAILLGQWQASDAQLRSALDAALADAIAATRVRAQLAAALNELQRTREAGARAVTEAQANAEERVRAERLAAETAAAAELAEARAEATTRLQAANDAAAAQFRTAAEAAAMQLAAAQTAGEANARAAEAAGAARLRAAEEAAKARLREASEAAAARLAAATSAAAAAAACASDPRLCDALALAAQQSARRAGAERRARERETERARLAEEGYAALAEARTHCSERAAAEAGEAAAAAARAHAAASEAIIALECECEALAADGARASAGGEATVELLKQEVARRQLVERELMIAREREREARDLALAQSDAVQCAIGMLFQTWCAPLPSRAA